MIIVQKARQKKTAVYRLLLEMRSPLSARAVLITIFKTMKDYTPIRKFYAWLGFTLLAVIHIAVIGYLFLIVSDWLM